MDLFHKIIDLVDKNSSVIPEGDYLELCDTIKELREKVQPPPFLLDQNEPMSFLQRWVDVDDEEELAHPGLNAFLQDLHAEWSATDDGNSMNDIIEKFKDEFITDRTKHNLPEETYRKVYEFYTQLWSAQ